MGPLEYLRQFRLGGYAVFDFAASFIGIYLLAPYLSKLFLKLRIDIPKKSWLYFTLPIGFLSHLLAGSITPMTRDIIDVNGHYLVKILMIALLILGIKGVKIVKKK